MARTVLVQEKNKNQLQTQTTDEHSPGMLCLNTHDAADSAIIANLGVPKAFVL